MPTTPRNVACALADAPRCVGTLPAGPVTILNWSFPRKDISRSAQAYQLALALRDEVADLEAAGCKVIQVRACRPPGLGWSGSCFLALSH